MKLATGIISLFVAVAAAIHTALIFLGSTFTGDSVAIVVGYVCMAMTALFIIGGALSFKEIKKAKMLYMVAAVIGAVSFFGISRSTIIWTIAATVLVFMSDNAEPHKVPAA